MRRVVHQAHRAVMLRAVRTAIDDAFGFHSVADHPAAAMPALRRQCVDRAFEAVEDMGSTAYRHLKGPLVLVSAHFTGSHWCPPREMVFVVPPAAGSGIVVLIIPATFAVSF